jgi:hypothetical protein
MHPEMGASAADVTGSSHAAVRPSTCGSDSTMLHTHTRQHGCLLTVRRTCAERCSQYAAISTHAFGTADGGPNVDVASHGSDHGPRPMTLTAACSRNRSHHSKHGRQAQQRRRQQRRHDTVRIGIADAAALEGRRSSLAVAGPHRWLWHPPTMLQHATVRRRYAAEGQLQRTHNALGSPSSPGSPHCSMYPVTTCTAASAMSSDVTA